LLSSAISNYSPLLDRKIEETVNGIHKAYGVKLQSIEQQNAEAIVDYIAAMRVETNLSDNYRGDNIETLTRLSKYHDNKPFKNLERTDIISFLDSMRKTEARDPMHKWIGTYNLFRIYLLRFFKWLYYPDIEPRKRPKPAVVENIAQLEKREINLQAY
jgi:site-specific recombinase XerD